MFRVCVRIRPLSSREREKNADTIVCPVDDAMLVFDPKPAGEPSFGFTRKMTRKRHKYELLFTWLSM